MIAAPCGLLDVLGKMKQRHPYGLDLHGLIGRRWSYHPALWAGLRLLSMEQDLWG